MLCLESVFFGKGQVGVPGEFIFHYKFPVLKIWVEVFCYRVHLFCSRNANGRGTLLIMGMSSTDIILQI